MNMKKYVFFIVLFIITGCEKNDENFSSDCYNIFVEIYDGSNSKPLENVNVTGGYSKLVDLWTMESVTDEIEPFNTGNSNYFEISIPKTIPDLGSVAYDLYISQPNFFTAKIRINVTTTTDFLHYVKIEMIPKSILTFEITDYLEHEYDSEDGFDFEYFVSFEDSIYHENNELDISTSTGYYAGANFPRHMSYDYESVHKESIEVTSYSVVTISCFFWDASSLLNKKVVINDTSIHVGKFENIKLNYDLFEFSSH